MGRVLASAGLLAIIRVFGMAAGFLVTIVLARMLGPEGLGLYGYAVILLTLASVPVTQGWGTLLLRTAARAKAGGNWAPTAGLVRCAMGIASALSVALFSIGLAAERIWTDGLPDALTPQLIFVLSVIFFLDQVTGLRLAILRGIGQPVWGQSPELLVRPVAIVIVFLTLAALFPPSAIEDAFWALLLATALSALVGAVVLRAKAPRELSAAVPSYEARQWSVSAAIMACNAWLVALITQLDVLLLGLLGSLEEVGIYRVAVQIASVSGLAYAALNFLAMDRFARFLERDSMEEVRRTAVLLARIALIGALPLPFLFALWGEEILGRAFGPEFHAAMAPLFLLLGLQVVTASFGMPNSLLMMSGYERRLLAATGTCVALDAILCLALIPRFGPTGAALASLLSVGALRVALWIAVYRTLRVDTSVVASLPAGRRWKGDCVD